MAFCRVSVAPTDDIQLFQNVTVRLISTLNAFCLESLQNNGKARRFDHHCTHACRHDDQRSGGQGTIQLDTRIVHAASKASRGSPRFALAAPCREGITGEPARSGWLAENRGLLALTFLAFAPSISAKSAHASREHSERKSALEGGVVCLLLYVHLGVVHGARLACADDFATWSGPMLPAERLAQADAHRTQALHRSRCAGALLNGA